MPILKHAKKKLRVDERRNAVNKIIKTKARKAIDRMRKGSSGEALSLAFSAIDRAAKKNVYHKRKADRLKSRLSKLIEKKS